VIKTFKIRDLVRQAIIACPDITDLAFPYLFENKKSTQNKNSGNVSKITKQAFRRLMIFIARIYQARIIVTKIGNADEVPAFTFDNYPELGEMFRCIEAHFHEESTKDRSVAFQKQNTALTLVHSLSSDLEYCKKQAKLLEDRLAKADVTQNELLKKVKLLEQKSPKSSKVPVMDEKQIDIMIEEKIAAAKERDKKLEKKKRKKEGKKSKKEEKKPKKKKHKKGEK
jgi:hypothetical protein